MTYQITIYADSKPIRVVTEYTLGNAKDVATKMMAQLSSAGYENISSCIIDTVGVKTYLKGPQSFAEMISGRQPLFR
jgi:sulfite reductase alpha subunit-like flavoprotein